MKGQHAGLGPRQAAGELPVGGEGVGQLWQQGRDDLFLHPLCEFMYEVANNENCYCVEKNKSGTIVKIQFLVDLIHYIMFAYLNAEEIQRLL